MTRMVNRKAAGEIKSPLRPTSILLATISIFYILLLLNSGMILTIQMRSMLLNCAFTKKSNLHLTKNYQGICLLNVASNVISVVIVDWCQSVLMQHGIDEQNGFLKIKRCLDATFLLKVALQTRMEFNLNTWVVFVDLVKAFDTVNQDMHIDILARFSLPEYLINVICCLYAGWGRAGG